MARVDGGQTGAPSAALGWTASIGGRHLAWIDAFNGDADGICALHQLRLAEPVDATLVTGLKRDIDLLAGVQAGAGDVVTALDISLDRNRAGLERLLAAGARVRYFDHHFAGEVPAHPRLEAHLDDSGATCTSMLVDRFLGGRHRLWAITGAFGDGFEEGALALARPLEVDGARLEGLRELGVVLNYNAYGETEADVMLHPAALYRVIAGYADPFEMLAREPVVAALSRQRAEDLRRAESLRPLRTSAGCCAYRLPDAAWSRRVSGTFANRLALAEPTRTHAVLTPRSDGGYVVSVRVPRDRSPSAVDFVRRFPTGGGRKAAAGIDHLPEEAVAPFLAALAAAYR